MHTERILNIRMEARQITPQERGQRVGQRGEAAEPEKPVAP